MSFVIEIVLNPVLILTFQVRRLRVQQRIKGLKSDAENGSEESDEMPHMPSSIPFLPPVTKSTLRQLYTTSLSFISGIIVFGGLIAPTVSSYIL